MKLLGIQIRHRGHQNPVERNTVRFDLSNWLIHFFRTIDPDDSSASLLPENMGFNNIYEGGKLPAFFMLRCALRQCRIWATWSYRNNVRTIYGHDPAVCFTEMPLAAFLEAGEQRENRGQAMSQYALVFPKASLYSIGANPAIYGLDQRGFKASPGEGGGPRILDTDLLPLREQYRYVTFNPSGSYVVDWTHEREWRWPYRGDVSWVEQELSQKALNGMGVVVKTKEEAQLVTYDILTLVDRGVVAQSHFSFILCAGDFHDYSHLWDPQDAHSAIQTALVDLHPHFSHSRKRLTELAQSFFAMARDVESTSPPDEAGEPGGCWLWLLDNSHELTRALVAANRTLVSGEGRYLVELYEFSDGRSLRQREKMTERLARRVSSRFGVKCGYYSVLGSDDPDGVPSYTDILGDEMFHNYA